MRGGEDVDKRASASGWFATLRSRPLRTTVRAPKREANGRERATAPRGYSHAPWVGLRSVARLTDESCELVPLRLSPMWCPVLHSPEIRRVGGVRRSAFRTCTQERIRHVDNGIGGEVLRAPTIHVTQRPSPTGRRVTVSADARRLSSTLTCLTCRVKNLRRVRCRYRARCVLRRARLSVPVRAIISYLESTTQPRRSSTRKLPGYRSMATSNQYTHARRRVHNRVSSASSRVARTAATASLKRRDTNLRIAA